jgi:hypothetical protein
MEVLLQQLLFMKRRKSVQKNDLEGTPRGPAGTENDQVGMQKDLAGIVVNQRKIL